MATGDFCPRCGEPSGGATHHCKGFDTDCQICGNHCVTTRSVCYDCVPPRDAADFREPAGMTSEAGNDIILGMHYRSKPWVMECIVRDHLPRYYEPGSITDAKETWSLSCQCGKVLTHASSRSEMWEPWVRHIGEIASAVVQGKFGDTFPAYVV